MQKTLASELMGKAMKPKKLAGRRLAAMPSMPRAPKVKIPKPPKAAARNIRPKKPTKV